MRLFKVDCEYSMGQFQDFEEVHIIKSSTHLSKKEASLIIESPFTGSVSINKIEEVKEKDIRHLKTAFYEKV